MHILENGATVDLPAAMQPASRKQHELQYHHLRDSPMLIKSGKQENRENFKNVFVRRARKMRFTKTN